MLVSLWFPTLIRTRSKTPSDVTQHTDAHKKYSLRTLLVGNFSLPVPPAHVQRVFLLLIVLSNVGSLIGLQGLLVFSFHNGLSITRSIPYQFQHLNNMFCQDDLSVKLHLTLLTGQLQKDLVDEREQNLC